MRPMEITKDEENGPRYEYRPLCVTDGAALARLDAECAASDHRPPVNRNWREWLHALDGRREGSVGGFHPAGTLLGYARVRLDEHLVQEVRAFHEIEVSPGQRRRGLGGQLLKRAESLAAARWAEVPNGRSLVHRIDFAGQGGGLAPFGEANGYRLAFAEDEMRRDLPDSIPDAPLPDGFDFAPWSEATASEFFKVASSAFRDRPGFPGWMEEVWRRMYTGSDAFRPELSLLAKGPHGPAGYVLAWVEPDETACEPVGYIAQAGVAPEWRRHGIARALLAEALRRFRVAGLGTALLEVNTNNPQARALYDSMGFRVTARYSSYQKKQPRPD